MKRNVSFVLILSMILTMMFPSMCFGEEDSKKEEVSYYGINDPAFVSDLQDACYDAFKDGEEDGEYTIEDVQAAYISKEYLEELSYNELVNIYFGYTLEEAEALAKGERWQFTLSDDGRTTVETIEESGNEIELFQEKVVDKSGIVLIHVVIKTIRGNIDFVFGILAQKIKISYPYLKIIEKIVDFLLAVVDNYLYAPEEGWKVAFINTFTELKDYINMFGFISEPIYDEKINSDAK